MADPSTSNQNQQAQTDIAKVVKDKYNKNYQNVTREVTLVYFQTSLQTLSGGYDDNGEPMEEMPLLEMDKIQLFQAENPVERFLKDPQILSPKEGEEGYQAGMGM